MALNVCEIKLLPQRRDKQTPTAIAVGSFSIGQPVVVTGGTGSNYCAGTNISISSNIINVCGTVASATCAATANNASCLGGYTVGNFACCANPNNFLHSGNEITLICCNTALSNIWINYRGNTCGISTYYLGAGCANGTIACMCLANLYASGTVCGTCFCGTASNSTCLGGYAVGCFAGVNGPTFTGLAIFCNACVCGTLNAANFFQNTLVLSNDGTYACPSLRFCTDQTRGLYKDTNNNVRLTTGVCLCESLSVLDSGGGINIRMYTNPNDVNHFGRIDSTCNMQINVANNAGCLEICSACAKTSSRLDVNSNSGSGGFVSSGNYQGTGCAAWFPCGVYIGGSSSWIYGTTVFNSSLCGCGGGWTMTNAGILTTSTACSGVFCATNCYVGPSAYLSTYLTAPIICASTCFVGRGAGNLSNLLDTCVVTPINYQVLQYNNTSSKWCNCTPTDITSNLTTGGILCYNGTTICSVSQIYAGAVPIATASCIGGVKVGTGLSIDGNGVLCAPAGSTTVAYFAAGSTCITAAATEGCMTTMSMNYTTCGTKSLITFTAPFWVSSNSQALCLWIYVNGNKRRCTYNNIYSNSVTMSLQHLETGLSIGSNVCVCVTWKGTTSILQCGTVGERTLSVLDLP